MTLNKPSYTLKKMKNYPGELLGTKMKRDMNVGITILLLNTITKLKTKYLKINLMETEDTPDVDPILCINPYLSMDPYVVLFTQ